MWQALGTDASETRENEKFKLALRKCLNTHTFYSGD
jgi:hypothetical protein